jgi:acyl-CoA hydrolase
MTNTTSTAAAKTVANSRCTMTEIVLPNDTNGLGNLMGGRLLHLMDKAAAISTQRHANRVCVTAAVDTVEFNSPIRQGEIIIIESQVNRAFRSSMEVELNVWAEDPQAQTRRKCNRAYYTFVAVDENIQPTAVPPIQPETKLEMDRYESASKRRELRLVMSGRIELRDATTLREDVLAVIRGGE